MEISNQPEDAWLNAAMIAIGVGVFVAGAVVDFRSRYRAKRPRSLNIHSYRRAITTKHASALLSYYTQDKGLTPVDEGIVDNMHYMAYMSAIDSAIIYRIELPFGSKVHLLGVPRHSNSKQINPTGAGSVFERVSLEGDYDNYFSLYCLVGQQVDTRYFLDPKTMAFTVDFCQSHSWELIDGELYFAQTGSNHPKDTTSMFDDVGAFVASIRPAVERQLTQRELQKITPYARDRRNNLKCPTCQKTMINEQTHYRCTDHHGVLLMGRYLTELRDGTLTIEAQKTEAVAGRGNIRCPSCSEFMAQVEYNGSRTIIDSCTNCPYRWLDGADIGRI